MSYLLAVSIGIMIGAVVPTTVVGMRGDAVDRPSGLVQLAPTSAAFLMVFAQAVGRTDYLIVPLTLALIGFTGSLVYARLMAPRK